MRFNNLKKVFIGFVSFSSAILNVYWLLYPDLKPEFFMKINVGVAFFLFSIVLLPIIFKKIKNII